MKTVYTILMTAALATVGNAVSAATVPYGVFEHGKNSKNNSETLSAITGDNVMQLAKVEDWGINDSMTVDGLTISIDLGADDGGDSTSGTWSYTGDGTIDWLVIKYGQNFGIYQITQGDTSGEWSIAQLENYSTSDDSGAKIRKDNFVHYSAISHATAYTSLITVPLPAAAWLFLGGIAGLVTIGRRKQ